MKDILTTCLVLKNQILTFKPIIILNMSARNNNKKQMAAKPYCKVCHDAGKSEKEYTSHYVKSAPGPEGKVVCPTLLSQSCGYCGSCGHTPKFCPTLAAEKAAEEKALKQAARRDALEKREAEKAAPKPAQVKKPQSSFAAAFGSDSDSETEKKVSKKVTKSIAFQSVANVAPRTAAKLAPKPVVNLVAKADEFPALPSAAKSEHKITGKPAAKTGFLEALNQVYPELKVATKMPEVPAAYRGPPLAKLVRRAEIEADVESEDEFPEPSDFTMADFVEAAYQRPQPMFASQMNWAMKEDSESDDEDW